MRNPNNPVLFNTYYPNGLLEKDIWNYWEQNKNKLKENTVLCKRFAVSLITNNGIVFRRYVKDDKVITFDDYDRITHGRVISLHNTMERNMNYGIIDIDGNLEECKKAAQDVLNILPQGRIKFSGSTGFHILIQYNDYKDIDDIRRNLYKELLQLSDKYYINKSRGVKVNIDLSSDKINGCYLSFNSLSNIGLISKEIDKKDIKNLNPNKFKIK